MMPFPVTLSDRIWLRFQGHGVLFRPIIIIIIIIIKQENNEWRIVKD